MNNPGWRTFWDFVAGSGGLYQMGPSWYRAYILDRLKELGVVSILEEGCGTGPIYQLISTTEDVNEIGDKMLKWPFEYKGTDFAVEMVRVAKEHFPEGNFEVEDARKVNESDSSYDAVLLIDTLDHLDDYKSAIAEAARVSKKYVVISLWRAYCSEGTNLNDKNMMNKEPDEQPWEDTHLQEYSKEVLLEEFKKNNLKVIEFNDSEDMQKETHARSLWILEKI